MISDMPKKKRKPAQSAATRGAIALNRARWGKMTPAERSAFNSRMGSRPRPGARHPDRCPCGAMTRKCAAARAHKCEAPEMAQTA
jgi:hypothetical protein